jgi:predicted nucleic acid-binding protein
MAICWLFEEEWTNASLEVLQQIKATGALVPSLWRLEIANVLRAAVKRGRCDEPFVDRSLRRLAALAITIDEQTDLHAWNATFALARSQGLTVYDAAYLELACRLGLPLATRDRELIAAAQSIGVAVLRP